MVAFIIFCLVMIFCVYACYSNTFFWNVYNAWQTALQNRQDKQKAYDDLAELFIKQHNRARDFEVVVKPAIEGETKMPVRSTKNSAGYDFFSKEQVSLKSGDVYKFTTDIKAYMKDNEVLLIVPRSSTGLQLVNQVGVIDPDYYNNPKNDGNILIKYKNETNDVIIINQGDKIAQGIFTNYLLTDTDGNTEKNERVGGIGSTGK